MSISTTPKDQTIDSMKLRIQEKMQIESLVRKILVDLNLIFIKIKFSIKTLKITTTAVTMSETDFLPLLSTKPVRTDRFISSPLLMVEIPSSRSSGGINTAVAKSMKMMQIR